MWRCVWGAEEGESEVWPCEPPGGEGGRRVSLVSQAKE